MRALKIIALVMMVLAAAGCAAPGPIFQPMAKQEGAAVVYVYRPKKFQGGGTYPHVYLNGVEQAPLRNGGYIALSLSPGEYKIESKGKDWKWDLPDKSVDIRVEEHGEYYIKLDYSMDMGVTGSEKEVSRTTWQGSLWVLNYGAGFQPIEGVVAKEEIKHLKLSM